MKRPLHVLAALAVLATAAFALPAQAQRTDINVGLGLEPPHLDPTAGAAAAIREVTYVNLYEGLTRFGPNGEILPLLAHDWEVSEDGLVWTFHLAEGVAFHDGAPFSAEDVAFSLDRARAEDSLNAQQWLFADIEEVVALDAATVEIRLTRPNGNLPFNLAWGDAVIVSPQSAESNATRPVGTGPFRFGSWTQGDSLTLLRNADYWGEPALLERATFRFISDPTAAFAAMMAEDVDTFPNFSAPETLPQLEADPRFEAMIGTTEGEVILAINNARPPLDDIRVRQAITHAVDRDAIIEGAMYGRGTPIGTHFAPHHPAYLDLLELSPHDPDQARALLAEAGAEGLSLTLVLPPPAYARRGGEIIAAQLRAVGIETRIVTMEWAQWLEQVFTGHDYDLTIISHVEPLDIEIYGRDDYYFGYDSPEFQAIMEEIHATVDEEARFALFQDAQRKISEDYVNAYLFQQAKSAIQNADLQGLWRNFPGPVVDLTQVHWAR